MKLQLEIRRPEELKVFNSLRLSMVVLVKVLPEVLIELAVELLVGVLTEIFIEVKASLVVYYLDFSVS